MLDHIERGNINFTALKTVVLDEADQMLKQGFKEEVDKVSSQLASARAYQNYIFCSEATYN